MTISRRKIIKSLAVASLLRAPAFPAAPITCNSTGHINIFIHGLFFMQVSRDTNNNLTGNLEIFAPMSNHTFWGGTRNNPIQLDASTIDWSAALEGGSFPGLTGKFPTGLPASALRFSRTDTNIGNITGSPLGHVILPWPKEFLSLRRGSLHDFVPQQSIKGTGHQPVGDNILLQFAHDPQKRVEVVLGFRYCYNVGFPPLSGFTPNINFHFFLDPILGSSVHHTNTSLIDAKQLFANGNTEFDLQLDESTGNTVTGLETTNLPPETNPEDQFAFDELFTSLAPPMAVEAIGLAPFIQKSTAISYRPAAGKQPKPSTHRPSRFVTAFANVSPANCPNFFVGE